VYSVYRTQTAYFNDVFLSKCNWNAGSLKPGAAANREHVSSHTVCLRDLLRAEHAIHQTRAEDRASRSLGASQKPAVRSLACSPPRSKWQLVAPSRLRAGWAEAHQHTPGSLPSTPGPR